ncbi:NADPH-dependent oxidoreductase [Bacillus sp. AFS031507]|nr:NADPH-dependent oxidoreductase [Bacillus sp. AFS031507]
MLTKKNTNRFDLEGIKLLSDINNQTLEILNSHESIRRFKVDQLPEGTLKAILTSARSASTSSNLHTYSIIIVTDKEQKDRLASLAGDQNFIREAPVFLVFCADLYRVKYVTERQNYEFLGDNLEMFITAVVDSALALQNATIAAESLGLATVPVGAVRNNVEEFSNLLGLPERVLAVAGLAVGYEQEGARRGIKPRLPEDVLIHHERYSTEHLEKGLLEYDELMSSLRTYDGRRISILGNVVDDDQIVYGWCEHTARRCNRPETISPAASLRNELKQTLEKRGFFIG